MLKDITFGQYYENKSLIHKLDPRVKIILMIVFVVFIFVSKNMVSLIFAAASVFAVAFVSRVPLKLYLKNMKAILPVLIFTSVLNVFYGNGGKVLLEFWVLEITTDGIYRSVFMTLRILLLIFISSALTYTTTPNDLTDGIESLLGPLKFIGLKGAVHTLAMMMTIALRFIPTLIEEAEKIMNAQKARGADLESGGLVDRVKALIPILIPLLISSVRRAYELAEAMECRCYNGGEGKTRMKQMTVKTVDFVSVFIVALFCGCIVLFNIIF